MIFTENMFQGRMYIEWCRQSIPIFQEIGVFLWKSLSKGFGKRKTKEWQTFLLFSLQSFPHFSKSLPEVEQQEQEISNNSQKLIKKLKKIKNSRIHGRQDKPIAMIGHEYKNSVVEGISCM